MLNTKQKPVLNALSFDIEEWYQAIMFDRNDYNDNEITRLPKNISEILSILNRHNTRATFFIVGILARKYPDVIKMIAHNGHEICSHGYLHRPVYRISRQEFIKDIGQSLEILKCSVGTQILGYRAPTWSITKNTEWAIEVLRSFGLKYDSSIYPMSGTIFNSRDHERFPYEIKNNFFEFPPSTFKILGYNFPFSGGTFLRLFPSGFIKNKILDINKKGHPAVVYFHSWEFEEVASMPKMPKLKYLAQYHNHGSVRQKIESLLQNFKFSSIKEVLQFE